MCRISLTSDVWKSPLNDIESSFICVTAHWIDDQWLIQKRIIAFKPFWEKHTGQAIANNIMDSVQSYNMRTIFTISFDNASNNTASIRYLKQSLNPVCDGKFFHVRCVCHILNLAVQAGLEACGLDIHVEKIRYAINCLRVWKRYKQMYMEFVKAHRLEEKLPSLDCKIRWNSTFKMLSRALKCRKGSDAFV